MGKKLTQTDLVLDYLNTHGTITPLEALRELGCFRLAARIHDIEQRGYVVPRRTVTVTGKKTGRKVRITEYSYPLQGPTQWANTPTKR